MDVTELLDGDAVRRWDVFSFVYHSRHRDGRAVAIKSPHPLWRGIFTKVLDIWAKCNHPNIVQLIGKATFRGELAVVYEWHEYGGIPDYLEHHPTADRYQLSAQICDGLAYLHANDIIHGDLQGNQILVSSDGVPRIQLSVLASSTIMDATEGIETRFWQAPELSRWGSKRTIASDVFALGITILETITREHPYGRGSNFAWVRQRAIEGKLPPRPTDKIPENKAGNAVWDILCRCWSYNPKDRPSAQNVCDVMHTVFQTPDGVALGALKLVVTEETTIQDLVTHYEQRRLRNYTVPLQQTGIAAAIPIFDTALANVFQVTLLDKQYVAVKCVKHTTPHKKLKRAARELSCWSSYEHENILPVLGFAVVRGDLAMVSEWMENGCVRDYVMGNLDCDRLVLCTQLSSAIAYLHEHDVVHGDIKGPNVLVSDAGIVKVTDFGVSIVDHQEIEFSGTSSGRGTQRWQAPEILLGQTDSTEEADVYALGMTMIEIYTGEQPYGSTNWLQLMQPIIHNQMRPSRPILLPADKIGNGIWGLIKYCWFADPSKRVTSTRVHEWLQYYITIRTSPGVV